ncbi:MAG: hypothetical protein ABI877_05850, partial [Gemmatimonadaceae bacterium]
RNLASARDEVASAEILRHESLPSVDQGIRMRVIYHPVVAAGRAQRPALRSSPAFARTSRLRNSVRSVSSEFHDIEYSGLGA